MSLLRASDLAAAEHAIALRRRSRSNALQRAMYGSDGTKVPAGFVRLERPEEQDVWMKHLARSALQEQEGFAPGDVATRAVEHPAVQQAVMNDQRGA